MALRGMTRVLTGPTTTVSSMTATSEREEGHAHAESSPSEAKSGLGGGVGHPVFIDLDTVLLATHQGRRGVELGVQADLVEGIERLSEIADQIVVLLFPDSGDSRNRLTAQTRLDTVREGLGDAALERMLIVSCPHAEGDRDAACECAKPGSGLIQSAIEVHDLAPHGWYVGADQAGVVAGRGAGLSTVRIGPVGEDHLSAVHRPDYEARDLLDAANHIMVAELA